MKCGYCREQGHNRKTCPKMKAIVESTLKEDPNDYHANRLKERYYTNKTKEQRKCGYCSEFGHARNKCDIFTNDVENVMTYYQNIHENESNIIEYVRPYFGKGDLVCHVEYKYKHATRNYGINKEICIVSELLFGLDGRSLSGAYSENITVQLNPIASQVGNFKPYYVPLSYLLRAKIDPSFDIEEYSSTYQSSSIIKMGESGYKTMSFSTDSWHGKTAKELFKNSCFWSTKQRNSSCRTLEKLVDNQKSGIKELWEFELEKIKSIVDRNI